MPREYVAELMTQRYLANPFHATARSRRAEFVTFHQSLTYESFVIGLHPKPVDAEAGGGLSFSPKDGIFLVLAEHALKEDSAGLLLIDELNRGNVADILGELITVLEDDKRLAPDGSVRATTVTVTLPLKPERMDQKFRMPSAFYVLASMNSLDRSVAPLDSALRRRFRLLNVAPDLDVARRLMLGGRAECGLDSPDAPSPDECKSLALAFLRRLNEEIRTRLGPEFQIGQSYILSIADRRTFVDAITDTVLPQLYELFRDRPVDLLELLGDKLVTLSDEASEVGLGVGVSGPANLFDVRRMEIGELMCALYAIAHGKPWTKPVPPAAPETET